LKGKVTLAAQLLFMLHVCHSYKIILNDIKLGNILIDKSGYLKFSDLAAIGIKQNQIDSIVEWTDSEVTNKPIYIHYENEHS
jgi:serine/threonine protein kinase